MIRNISPEPAFGAASGFAFRILPASEDAFARLKSVETAGSPFQSAGWLQAFLRSQGSMENFRLLDLAFTEGGWLVLPLKRDIVHGIAVFEKIGGAHASFFAPAASGRGLPDGMLRDALQTAATAEGIDAILLADCPTEWAGAPHPLLVLDHRPAPSDAAFLHLDGAPDDLMARLFDREGLKKQRYKRRKLGDLGVLSAGWAPCETSAEMALEQFFDWKSRQFQAMGVPDPFATPEVKGFLWEAVCGPERSVRLFTLTLDGRPVAVVGVARCGTHASGMFTAYSPATEIARFSPGDVAMGELVVALRQEGCTGFDLGIGEARYKNQFCPDPLPVVDIAEGFTLRGQLTAATWLAFRGAKRVIKRNPRLFDLAKGVRRRLRA